MEARKSQVIIEDGPVIVDLTWTGGHDTLFALQHGAEAILRRIVADYGRIAAQGAVPLELQGEAAR